MARWSPLALPDFKRAHLADLRRLSVDKYSDDLLVDAGPLSELLREYKQTKQALRRDYEEFHAAELFWVTSDMTRVALDASTDLPEFSTVNLLPSPNGALFWAGGLPQVSWALTERVAQARDERDTMAVSLDGVVWRARRGVIEYDPLTRDPKVLGPPLSLGDRHRSGAAPLYTLQVHDSTATSVPEVFADRPCGRAPTWYMQETAAIERLIGATFLMMRDDTDNRIATVSNVWRDPARHRRGKPPRQTGEVKVVDVRPMRHKPTAAGETDAQGRVYTHRWVVRGHWRQQAHGPGRALRTPRWIPSYVKGPEGAPLIDKAIVHVWRS